MTEKPKKYWREFPPHKVAERALVVGDPNRAADAATLLEDAEEIWNAREYRAFTGEHNGVKITVCSHGVGGAGALTIFEPLIHSGVKTLIRAGTCGGFQEDIKTGDVLIGTGSIREDGVTTEILPIEFPAIAECRVTHALEVAAAEHGCQPHVGLMRTTSLFFNYPGSVRPQRFDLWQKAGVIGGEMEYSTLLVLAAYHQVSAGGIFVADGVVSEHMDVWEYNPGHDAVTKGKQLMLKIAISALARL